MAHILTYPNIDSRFLPKENWKINSFLNPETNREIFYRTAFVDKPEAIIFILPGLSEYAEKYIETITYFNDLNYNVVIIDWAYQGLSNRFDPNRHKRHSDGISADISDLRFLITQKIKSNLPHYMLAHSMGGNIGMRYVIEHPQTFEAISASAPMLGIKGICECLKITNFLLRILSPLKNFYVPGGHDWSERDRKDIINNMFSHDKERKEVHNAWMVVNPQLQVGNPTYQWLKENMNSICTLKNKTELEKITVPVLLGLAANDKVVDNKSIINADRHLPNSQILELEGSAHEILMECDPIRNNFLSKTIALFKQ